MMKTRIVVTVLLLAAAVLLFQQNSTPSNESLFQRQKTTKKLRINDPFYQDYLQAKVFMTFEEFRHHYKKAYRNQEERLYRMQIYNRTLKQIADHNLLYQSGKSTFFKGITKFADITGEEFVQMHASKEGPSLKATAACTGSIMDAPNPPVEFDWGNKVSEVKDQGGCGKAWAIVAVESVQSLYALKMGVLPSLSTQQLLECSGDYGNEGCDGGFMDQAFWYIIDTGIATDKSYPVRDPKGQRCKYSPNMKFTTITKCARVPSKSYSKLLSAIVQQPVSVAVNLNPAMKDYSGAIYDGDCTTLLNTGMLLVGYGGKQVEDYYWKLKNNMGTSWGKNGFINLKRVQSDGDGACGIQIWPSVPQDIV